MTKDIDWATAQFEGISAEEIHGDEDGGYLSYLEYADGVPLTDAELEHIEWTRPAGYDSARSAAALDAYTSAIDWVYDSMREDGY